MGGEMWAAIVGAILGAVAGFAGTVYYTRSQEKRRRESVATALLAELSRIGQIVAGLELETREDGREDVSLEPFPREMLDRFPDDVQLFNHVTVGAVFAARTALDVVDHARREVDQQPRDIRRASSVGDLRFACEAARRAVYASMNRLVQEGGKEPQTGASAAVPLRTFLRRIGDARQSLPELPGDPPKQR